MTRKIHVHLIDDLDASEASETLRFEVDGRTYEIDLSSRNAQRFRAEIAPYITHARRVVSHTRGRGRAGTGSGPPRGVARAAPRSSVMSGGPRADAGATVPDYTGGPAPGMDLGDATNEGPSASPEFGDEQHAP
ncbi:MAG TPA: Lsr2 family protein [Streptosporangiaceae bacterium]|nr:Lsr2 family protein [Streptosporangiaceae bacterium]